MPFLKPIITIGHIDIKSYDILYILFIVRIVIQMCLHEPLGRLPNSHSVVILSLFIVWSGISTFIARYGISHQIWLLQIVSFARFVEFISFAFIVPLVITKPAQLRKIFYAIIIIALIQIVSSSVHRILISFFNIDWKAKHLLSLNDGNFFRLTGTFCDPATFGDFLVFAFLLALVIQEPSSKLIKILFWVAPFGIILTRTRTTIIGLLLSLIVLFTQQYGMQHQKFRTASAIGVGLIVAFITIGFMGIESIWIELFRLRVDDSILGRTTLMEHDLDVFLSNPLLGVGWTGSRSYLPQLNWADSLYTRLLADLGIFGIVLLLGFFATLLKDSFRLVIQAKTLIGADTAKWVHLSTVAFLGMSVGDITFYAGSSLTFIFFFIVGILFAGLGMEMNISTTK